MKFMFSEFPGGTVGLALLMLRWSAVLQMAGTINEMTEPAALSVMALGLLGVAIGVGFLTRIAAALCATYWTVQLLAHVETRMMLVATHALDTTCLALLGPGACSIDARLFGRRVITLGR